MPPYCLGRRTPVSLTDEWEPHVATIGSDFGTRKIEWSHANDRCSHSAIGAARIFSTGYRNLFADDSWILPEPALPKPIAEDCDGNRVRAGIIVRESSSHYCINSKSREKTARR